MFKRLIKNPLFWIFVISLLLRIYKLGIFPYGFHTDEVRVGWNALSILQTGKDDHGDFLSLYYNTFGDYRPTGIFYLTIPSIFIFGNTEFAVRFSSAFFGALTSIALYYLVQEITNKKRISILAALLIALSPWHIETSRATSEVVISTFFALLGIYYFIKVLKNKDWRFAIFSFFLFLISYSLYHSIRILAPVLVSLTFIYYFPKLKKILSNKLALIVLLSISTVTFVLSLSNDAEERFKQVSISRDPDFVYEISRIKSENQSYTFLSKIFDSEKVIYIRKAVSEYSKYFSPDFLIGNAARPFRYRTPGVGLMTYAEIIIFAVGLITIFQKKNSSLPLLLLLISPLTAAITLEDSPNLHRAFLMLPFIVTIESYGLNYFWEVKKYKKLTIIFIFGFLLLNFIYFIHMYLNHSISHKPFIKDFFVDSPTYRNIGAKELVTKIEMEKGNYDKVIVTNFPDNLYPWYAFLTYKEPFIFNNSIVKNSNTVTYKNIIFSDIKCPSDDSFTNFKEKRILIIDNWECGSESKIKAGLAAKIVGTINRPDGSVVYKLLERN